MLIDFFGYITVLLFILVAIKGFLVINKMPLETTRCRLRGMSFTLMGLITYIPLSLDWLQGHQWETSRELKIVCFFLFQTMTIIVIYFLYKAIEHSEGKSGGKINQ